MSTKTDNTIVINIKIMIKILSIPAGITVTYDIERTSSSNSSSSIVVVVVTYYYY